MTNALAKFAQRLSNDPVFREEFGQGSDAGLSELTDDEQKAVGALRPLISKGSKELSDIVRARLENLPRWNEI